MTIQTPGLDPASTSVNPPPRLRSRGIDPGSPGNQDRRRLSTRRGRRRVDEPRPEEKDAFALRSHQLAARAYDDGVMDEVAAVPGAELEGDEGIRADTSSTA